MQEVKERLEKLEVGLRRSRGINMALRALVIGGCTVAATKPGYTLGMDAAFWDDPREAGSPSRKQPG